MCYSIGSLRLCLRDLTIIRLCFTHGQYWVINHHGCDDVFHKKNRLVQRTAEDILSKSNKCHRESSEVISNLERQGSFRDCSASLAMTRNIIIHTMKKIPALLFFLFICWIIFLADTDQENWIMKIGHSIRYGDKIGHFVLYGLLSFFINVGMSFRRIRIQKYYIFVGSAAVLLFAFIEEFTQLFLIHRNFDFIDMLFDVLGIASFSILSSITTQRRKNKTRVATENR